MQVRIVIFPSDDGLSVVIWGKWTQGSMRVRRFDTRTNMTQTLQGLGLITDEDALRIDKLTFEDSCPLFSAEIDEDTLAAHGFLPPES